MSAERTARLAELRHQTRLAELRSRKQASTGRDILYSLLEERAFMKLYRKMEKNGDEQSTGLLRDITEKLTDALDLSTNEMAGLRRVQTCVENADRWDEALLRNNIFKAANHLGIRLPSGMFASAKPHGKTAAEDTRWFKGEIEKALQIMEDTCDVADRPGGLSDENGTVSNATTAIRRVISRDLDKLVKTIK